MKNHVSLNLIIKKNFNTPPLYLDKPSKLKFCNATSELNYVKNQLNLTEYSMQQIATFLVALRSISKTDPIIDHKVSLNFIKFK